MRAKSLVTPSNVATAADAPSTRIAMRAAYLFRFHPRRRCTGCYCEVYCVGPTRRLFRRMAIPHGVDHYGDTPRLFAAASAHQ